MGVTLILGLVLVAGASPAASLPSGTLAGTVDSFPLTEAGLVGLWATTGELVHPEQEHEAFRLKRVNARGGDSDWGWGGLGSGFELAGNGEFREYQNVGCSSESDPVRHHEEHWRLDDARRQIVVEGDARTLRLAVVALTGSALVVLQAETAENTEGKKPAGATPSTNEDLSTGVDLVNDDAVPHKVTFALWGLTTAICEARKGNRLGLKRGLGSVTVRGAVKGFRIEGSRAGDPSPERIVEAGIDPKTHVYCLCPRDCRVQLGSNRAIEARSGQTLVIKDSILTVK